MAYQRYGLLVFALKNTLHIEGTSFMCSSVRFPRVILVNVRSAYFTYGEFVMGEGLFFGQAEIYAIFQIDLRTYRVTFSPNDKGILVSASLMLEMREG